VFPDPKLEENERGQLYGYRLRQEETLYSYGWVDEKSGTVRIPIERAMDLLVQRGLPVRAQGSGMGASTASPATNTKAEEKQ
jgi:DNA-binding GntR family transcriptional regulator